MKTRLLLFALPLLAIRPLAGADDAVIEGRVTLPAPPAAPIIPQRYEVVSNTGLVAASPPRAVVYLEGEFPHPAAPATAQLAQKDLAFSPSLLPIQVGTRVEFPNHDNTFHNIFSFSPTKRFDLGRYRPNDEPVPSQVFDVAGLVILRCEIHQHMRGLILVLDTPYFVVTDGTGRYRLTGLPAGKYRLKAWVDSQTTHTQTVDLGPGTTLHADFP
jgi:plastocyanin